VHVMGYITSDSSFENLSLSGRGRASEVGVQALGLWSAKAIKLDEYERVVEERLRMENRGSKAENGADEGLIF